MGVFNYDPITSGFLRAHHYYLTEHTCFTYSITTVCALIQRDVLLAMK